MNLEFEDATRTSPSPLNGVRAGPSPRRSKATQCPAAPVRAKRTVLREGFGLAGGVRGENGPARSQRWKLNVESSSVHLRALLLAILFVSATNSHAGRVHTLDRRILTGTLLATNGVLMLHGTNATPETVPLTNLLAAWFEEPGLDGPSTSKSSGLGLLGYYFPSPLLTGTPYVRLDETVDFDWNQAEPAPGLRREQFSVAWTGELEAPVSGQFTFHLAASDHARLFFTNQLLLAVGNRGTSSDLSSTPVTLTAGERYGIRLQYVESGGPAGVRLLWSGPELAKSVIPKSQLHPLGFGSNHTAQITSGSGLLATYYVDAEFGGGSTFTRVDPMIDFDWNARDPAPEIPRTNFSVRWTGRLRAEHTEEYTFYAMTDERVRFWLEGKLLIDRPEQGWLAESKESLPLVAGEQYEVRMETKSTGGGAIAKLHWSSGSIERTNVPSTHLIPSLPAASGPGVSELKGKIPPGIVLRNGSFVAGQVEHATPTSVRATGLLARRPLSMVNVARIICQPLPPGLVSRIGPGRIGLLLTKGDFVDGDLRSLEGGRVSLNSILFGVRTFDVSKEVAAVALRDPYPPDATFEVRLRDQSVLLPRTLTIENDGLLQLEDTMLGPLRMPLKELRELRRRNANVR